MSPLHPVLPLLIEVYVNSVVLPNAKTSDFTNKPLTENEIRRVFRSSIFGPYFNTTRSLPDYNFEDTSECDDVQISQNSLTPQLLLLYYLLLYEDLRLNSAQSLAASGRKIVIYSSEFMSELPIKYLLHQAQKNQQSYSSLFGPLLRLLVTHFPHLALVEDWLDDMCLTPSNDKSEVAINERDVIEAFENIQSTPYKMATVLQQFLKKSPIDIWPFAKLFTSYAKHTLNPKVPRFVQELYKQVWLRLNTVLPRHLWVQSTQALVSYIIFIFLITMKFKKNILFCRCLRLYQCLYKTFQLIRCRYYVVTEGFYDVLHF